MSSSLGVLPAGLYWHTTTLQRRPSLVVPVAAPQPTFLLEIHTSCVKSLTVSKRSLWSFHCRLPNTNLPTCTGTGDSVRGTVAQVTAHADGDGCGA